MVDAIYKTKKMVDSISRLKLSKLNINILLLFIHNYKKSSMFFLCILRLKVLFLLVLISKFSFDKMFHNWVAKISINIPSFINIR